MKLKHITGPKSNPYVAELKIDPAQLRDLEQFADDRPELCHIHTNDTHPDTYIVYVGCASAETKNRLEDGWN